MRIRLNFDLLFNGIPLFADYRFDNGRYQIHITDEDGAVDLYVDGEKKQKELK